MSEQSQLETSTADLETEEVASSSSPAADAAETAADAVGATEEAVSADAPPAAGEAEAAAEAESAEAKAEAAEAELQETTERVAEALAEAFADEDLAAEMVALQDSAVAAEKAEAEASGAAKAPAEADVTAASPETAIEGEAEKAEAKGEETKPKKAKPKKDKPKKAEAKGEKPEEQKADAEGEKSEEQKADAEKTGDDEAKAAAEEIESEEMRELRAAMTAKLSLEGQVIGWNKGGYHVALGKIAAFCPVSQIEIGNPRSPKKYLDKAFDFRIIEIEEGGRRVVVSRAAALRAKRAADAAKVREQLEAGVVMKGRVSSITDFGAFVNLGGNIEGLVHISEVSRQRIEHAKEVLKPGQKVKVKVLKVEKGGKRISLSMKALEADPWDGVEERYESGGEFKGKIVRKTDFGLFVEVEPGLEGLVHMSRLTLGAKLEEDESLAEGQEIEGWVHDVDPKRKRLSLSMRPVAEGNPWKDVRDRYPEGNLFDGKVERVTKFGVFIELEPGLTGLLPFAVLGGGITNPKRQFQAGKTVKVKILSVDTNRKRISLGTESSKAEGSDQDYKNYVKTQRKQAGGLGALAQALAKVKDQIPVE